MLINKVCRITCPIYWYHHIVLAESFKVVSFFTCIYYKLVTSVLYHRLSSWQLSGCCCCCCCLLRALTAFHIPLRRWVRRRRPRSHARNRTRTANWTPFSNYSKSKRKLSIVVLTQATANWRNWSKKSKSNRRLSISKRKLSIALVRPRCVTLFSSREIGHGHHTHFHVAENLVLLKIILHGKQSTDDVS